MHGKNQRVRARGSCGHLRLPRARRPSPVDAFEQHRELRTRQEHRSSARLWPDEAAVLKALVEQVSPVTQNSPTGGHLDFLTLGDRVIATAILDRVLHHAITLNIRGNSYRLKEKLKAGLVRSEESATAIN